MGPPVIILKSSWKLTVVEDMVDKAHPVIKLDDERWKTRCCVECSCGGSNS
jgi:hypothetical protein